VIEKGETFPLGGNTSTPQPMRGKRKIPSERGKRTRKSGLSGNDSEAAENES